MINCPRCHIKTYEIQHKTTTIDYCDDGCGGIWFDWMELQKMDEESEVCLDLLSHLENQPPLSLDLSEKLNCPCCKNQPLYRRFYSINKKFEMDECPHCGGIWLDAGELRTLLTEFKTQEEKSKATQAFVVDIFSQIKNDSAKNPDLLKTQQQAKRIFSLFSSGEKVK